MVYHFKTQIKDYMEGRSTQQSKTVDSNYNEVAEVSIMGIVEIISTLNTVKMLNIWLFNNKTSISSLFLNNVRLFGI